MLLQKVILKGFLSHLGVEDGGPNGSLGGVELDFRGSPLWLIHGPNGSGKSAIFDAVTFALYNKARDQGKGFGDFVNDKSDRAHVEIEVEIGGVGYHVSRAVSKKGRGLGSRVHRLTEGGLQAEPGTDGKVPAWTERTLRLSYENFVCAALLRQGEADVFLRAKPADRKAQLMKLLDLDAYKRLAEAANRRKSQRDAVLRDRRAELEACAAVTDADLEAAAQAVTQAERVLAGAQGEMKAREACERDAAQAADWAGQIARKESQQKSDAGILSQSGSIEADAERHHELELALPLLRELWRGRETLRSEEGALSQTRQELARAEADLGALAPHLTLAKETEAKAKSWLEEAHEELGRSEKEQQDVEREAKELERVESLEEQIVQAEAILEPHREILRAQDEIKAAFERYSELESALGLLRPLLKSEKKVQEAAAQQRQARQARGEAEGARAEASKRAREREQVLEALEKAIEEARSGLEQARLQRDALREKLSHRTGLEHEEECPTCGSALRDPATRARLERQRSAWEEQARSLDGEVEGRQQYLQERQDQKKLADHEEKAAREALSTAEKALATAQEREASIVRQQDEAQREMMLAQAAAGAWAARAREFETLSDEHRQLREAGASERHELLLRAQRESAQPQATVQVCRDQLNRLPPWQPEERLSLRERAGQAQAVRDEAEANTMRAALSQKQATQEREKLEAKSRALAGERGQLEARRQEREQRAASAASEVERALGALPERWAGDAAAREEGAITALEGEFESLVGAPGRAEDLHQARERVGTLQAQVRTLQEQLDALPPAHRVAPHEAREQKERAEAALRAAQGARDQARRARDAREGERRARQKGEERRDEAEREASRASKLAGAFGPGGLQAQVVREAQGQIATLANDVLGRLSQHSWQVDLIESGDELQIVARDLARGGVARSFECLSGGERFRVAISLAIAIGQSACGGCAPATLVIDEGFGALDDTNRGLLVGELRRLSQEVLRGGRIIIVSHQEDVCSEFDFRFHVSRGPDGYARVQRHTPAD